MTERYSFNSLYISRKDIQVQYILKVLAHSVLRLSGSTIFNYLYAPTPKCSFACSQTLESTAYIVL